MSDEQMDARLRAAGESWRAAHTAASTAAIEPAPAETEVGVPHRAGRRWGLFASAAVVAAALVVGGSLILRGSGTSPGPAIDTAALEGTVWQLTGLNGNPADPHSSALFYLDQGGHLVADDECKLIGGTAHVDGSTLTVADLTVRYKSCVDQYGAGFYDDGIAILRGPATVVLAPSGLTIERAGKSMHFVPAPQDAPRPTPDIPTLIGADWTLVAIKAPDGSSVPVAGEPRLLIGDDGAVSGSDGCNSLTGAATLDPNGLTFGSLGGTEMYCSLGAAKTAEAVHSVLTGTVEQVVLGGRLELTKPGAGTLTYRWAPTSAATDPATLQGSTWYFPAAAGAVLRFGADGALTGNDGCAPIEARAVVGHGTMTVSGVPETPSCGDASAATLDSYLQGDVLWSVREGRLLVSTGGAQGSALAFSSRPNSGGWSASIVGPTWQLSSVTFGDGRYRNGAPTGAPSTLTISDTGYEVVHACYSVRGDVTHSASAITFSNGHTVDAHPCPLNTADSATSRAVDVILTGATTWSIDAGQLTITRAGEGELMYSDGSAAAADLPLRTTDWRLETAVLESGAELAAGQQRFTIDRDGTLMASDGVNTISGPVTVDGANLTFGNLITTDIGSQTADPVRDAVVAMLSGTVGFTISGDALTLTKGPAALVYRPAAPASTNDSITGTWQLTTVEQGTGPDGTASTPSVPTELRIDDTGLLVLNDCEGSTATITSTGLDITQVWARDAGPCPGLADVENILAGSLAWTIQGNQLTITKSGVGALIFERVTAR